VEKGRPSFPSVASLGRGGACFVADLNFAGYPGRPGGTPERPGGTCKVDLECQTKPDGTRIMPSSWVGYCVEDYPNPTHEGRCWVRPGPPKTTDGGYCRRSKDEGGIIWPLREPQKLHPIPWNVEGVDPPINPVDIKWRIHACLNVYDPALNTDVDGCKGAP